MKPSMMPITSELLKTARNTLSAVVRRPRPRWRTSSIAVMPTA